MISYSDAVPDTLVTDNDGRLGIIHHRYAPAGSSTQEGWHPAWDRVVAVCWYDPDTKLWNTKQAKVDRVALNLLDTEQHAMLALAGVVVPDFGYGHNW